MAGVSFRETSRARIPGLLAGLFCLSGLAPPVAVACGWGGEGEDAEVVVEAVQDPDASAYQAIRDPAAQTAMGNRFRSGAGGRPDYARAMRWYQKAADQGFPPAENNLGVMYEKGLGLPKNDIAAAKWFRRAAGHGDAQAQHSLGVMFREGRGVPKDLQEAARLILESAEGGHPGAMADMGEMYWTGSGVPQDDVHAHLWWSLAAKRGSEASADRRTLAASRMAAERVAAAEKLEREWKPREALGPPRGPGQIRLEDEVGAGIVVNYRRTTPTLATGGLILDNGITELEQLGFSAIIDLRTPAEGTESERAAAEATGLRYTNLPVGKEAPTMEQVRRFGTLIEDPTNHPVLVHCRSGNRVGTLWALYRISEGVPLEIAIEEGRAIGMQPSRENQVLRAIPTAHGLSQ